MSVQINPTQQNLFCEISACEVWFPEYQNDGSTGSNMVVLFDSLAVSNCQKLMIVLI